jgi:hypothetical protein
LILCFKTSGGGGAIPQLTANGVPKIGASYQLVVNQAKTNSIGLLFFGFSKTTWSGIPLPFSLAVVGAPGCNVLASGEIVVVVNTNAAGIGTYNANVPNDPNLCKGILYNQVFVFDPTANSLGFVATNAGESIHGN